MPTGVYPHKCGSQAANWKGGLVTDCDGYVHTFYPGAHTFRDHKGYVRLHILVAESMLGRRLPMRTIVHHIDGNPQHNYPSNLVICEDARYHLTLHQRARAFQATGCPLARICCLCHQWETDLETGVVTRNRSFRHRACHACYERVRRRKEVVYGLVPT